MLKLKMMRFNLGLTQREVAEKMGVTEASYNGWENETRAPHAQNVKKLADFFDVPTEEIFFIFYDHNNSQKEIKN